MKKYIIITIILLSIIEIKAQDSQPDGLFLQMYKNSSTFTKQINIADFQQNHFIMGWQWGGHPKLTEALKMNCNENHEIGWYPPIIDSNTSNIDINYIMQMEHGVTKDGGTPNYSSRCFIYKPTLTFDANMNVINPTDPEHNIFGFKVNTTSNTINQNKLELDKGLNYTNPILQKPWINDRFSK